MFKSRKLTKNIEPLQEDKNQAEEYEQLRKRMQSELSSFVEQKNQLQKEVLALETKISESNATLLENASDLKLVMRENEAQQKSISSNLKKLNKIKSLYSSIEYSIKKFSETTENVINPQTKQNIDELLPDVSMQLAHMNFRELRKSFNENSKQIDKLVDAYATNYTLKSNQAIYKLMTIAIRAELQNILYNMKYDKLDKSINQIMDICNKYLEISIDGNQTIAPTLKKFIGQLEYYFINAVKIEYNYYVKKEQQKQEQAEARERRRQEAAERKALAEERRKIEAEEQKYKNELANLEERLANPDISEEEKQILNSRVLEVKGNLSNVVVIKDKIITLQNGLAGTVYIISNLGAFGENVFKIGMTRRIEPMDRVKELGDASVPFPFDVHSLIYSNNASELETEIHKRLKAKRINKVNLRKEFFNITIDELEELVYEIQPSSEFVRNQTAEQYTQSLSTDDIYDENYVNDVEDIDDFEDEEIDETIV